MTTTLSLRRIEEQIQKAPPQKQREFLRRLPQILRIAPDDWSLLKNAESSFTFGDNLYDDRYNDL